VTGRQLLRRPMVFGIALLISLINTKQLNILLDCTVPPSKDSSISLRKDVMTNENVVREDYAWQKPYHDAVLETDNEKLKQSISYAEWIIDLRLNESSEMSADESKQIARILTALSILKTERIAGHSPGL